MADYNAILRRTLDGLGTTTPDLREKLFDRARATIARQLDSADPPMAGEAIAEQKAQLEAAIAQIENEYRAAEGSAAPAIAEAPAQAASMQPLPEQAVPSQSIPAPPEVPQFVDDPVGIPAAADDRYKPAGNVRAASSSGSRSGLIAIIIGILVIGGGAAALWLNKDALMAVFDQGEVADGPRIIRSTGGKTTPPAKTAPNSQVSTVKNNQNLPASSTVEPVVTEKFDQRLNENGEETAPEPIQSNNDTLPVGVAPSPVTTTRIVVPNVSGTNPDPNAAATSATGNNTTPASTGGNAAVVAQTGLLSEEGASQDQNSVDVGNVVWSTVQESPGDGLPLEPAIRARVEIGSRGMVLLMTIKRNADKALPASHIIELVFSVPDDFSGGGIDKIQRFVLKQSEEARGEALVGVPATIADGIFLIALNNLPEAVARNTALMKTQEWIDIPLGYRTGRRALITIEKGVPGERVFKEAFAAWEKAG